MSDEAELSAVSETMLQTLYARAKESSGRGAIRDTKAEEIIERLNCNFSAADKDNAMSSGVVARTVILDRLVKQWLNEHTNAVVVNIACGLDTRCYRVQGYEHWYNLDLPEAIAVRRKLMPEEGRITQIAMSAMEDWGNEVANQGDSTLIIIEGLTMYLQKEDVQRIFAVISERIRKATVFVETMNPTVAKFFREKSIDATGARFSWGVQNGKKLAEMLPDFKYINEYSLAEGMAAFVPIYKVLNKLAVVRSISNKIIVLEKNRNNLWF